MWLSSVVFKPRSGRTCFLSCEYLCVVCVSTEKTGFSSLFRREWEYFFTDASFPHFFLAFFPLLVFTHPISAQIYHTHLGSDAQNADADALLAGTTDKDDEDNARGDAPTPARWTSGANLQVSAHVSQSRAGSKAAAVDVEEVSEAPADAPVVGTRWGWAGGGCFC